MQNSLQQSNSLPSLHKNIIHSKQTVQAIQKPKKYPIFEKPQFSQQQNELTTYHIKSPLRINPAIQQAYSKYKHQEIKSYRNEMYEQYKMFKTQRRLENEYQQRKQWRKLQEQKEKESILYLSENYDELLQLQTTDYNLKNFGD